MSAITVFLADDNLLVREGARAILSKEPGIEVVGTASDYYELIAGAEAAAPQVIVTDVRMPPTFQREGIEAAKLLRKRYPGTGVVVLSAHDDPQYAIALLSEGSAGYGYLLKDRVADGHELADAVRTVATGGTALDPTIAQALAQSARGDGDLAPDEEELLDLVAAGRSIKAIAASRHIPPEAASRQVERLFLTLANSVSEGTVSALGRLRRLHEAIVDQKEQGDTLSRLLPGRLAEKLRADGRHIGATERVDVTVLMSDIRSYSTIAEHSDPTELAAQLNTHRAAMNDAILGESGTVMQFIGDAVMAVFGAPFPQADHAERAMVAAGSMHTKQAVINGRWQEVDKAPFGLGIGLSTGDAAAALLGSEERLEYTIVGDTVNLAQRLQQLALAGETVVSDATWRRLASPPAAILLEAQLVKGRETPVVAYKLAATNPLHHRSA